MHILHHIGYYDWIIFGKKSTNKSRINDTQLFSTDHNVTIMYTIHDLWPQLFLYRILLRLFSIANTEFFELIFQTEFQYKEFFCCFSYESAPRFIIYYCMQHDVYRMNCRNFYFNFKKTARSMNGVEWEWWELLIFMRRA